MTIFALISELKALTLLAFVFFFVLLLGAAAYFLYRRCWRIPAPNEALVIAGKAKSSRGPVSAEEVTGDAVQAISEGRQEGLDFRISTSATWVNPITNRVFRLPLDSRQTDFEVQCHDAQKIACRVKGVILYKVGDNYPAMRNAARRFLEMSEDNLNASIRDLVTGQVRALVGGMTIPDLITDRQKLMDNIRDATHEDMAKLGLQIDSLTVQDISDDNGYIEDLGRPQAEAVAREASIAADMARKDKERAAKEADLEIAKVTRDTEVEAARYRAEQDRAREEAAQAGPLAKAEAQRAVVAKQTEVAELEVAMTEKKLDAEVRKAAEAERYAAEQRAEAEKAKLIAEAEAAAAREELLGQAEAEATKRRGEAEAKAIQARLEAEAVGIEARATALAEHGDVVIEERIAEKLPEISRAFAEPLGAVDNMVVLDGPEGLTKGLVGAISAAGQAVQQVRGLAGRGGEGPGGGEGPEGGEGPDTDGGGGGNPSVPPAPAGPAAEQGTDYADLARRVSGADGEQAEAAREAGGPPATEGADPTGLSDLDRAADAIGELSERVERGEGLREALVGALGSDAGAALKQLAGDPALAEYALGRVGLSDSRRADAERALELVRQRIRR